ncbi:hypothetical protein [Streptomyces sp. 1222.5]|uniref:hypothetical protein n=1 Tax=Streptomyces sp. 1222.5 TaxID=1881026 RepID=UPI003EB8FDC1
MRRGGARRATGRSRPWRSRLPPPCTPADDTPAAQKEAAEAERSRLYWFIHVRLRTGRDATDDDGMALGYMSGRAEVAIELDHLFVAGKEFERMRAMATSWCDHSYYQQAVEGQA